MLAQFYQLRKPWSVIGKFIWKSGGWLLRIPIEEIKNSREKGGLGLLCISSMCKSLLLTQFLRLLKSEDPKTMSHVSYWIGDTLGDLVPGIDDGPHAEKIPDYFAHIEFLVMEAKMDNLITDRGWRQLTNKKTLYGTD